MTSTFEPTATAVDFDNDYQHTIGGRRYTSPTTFAVVNPATRDVIASVPDATAEQLDDAVAAARAAFASWSTTDIRERQDLVSAIGDRIEQHAEEFMALLTREQGKPRAGAEFEIFGSIAWCREMATMSLDEEIVEETGDRLVVTRHTPIGVVGGIIPWNFPVILAMWKIIPALVTGNCIVVKPSQFTPLTALKLAEVCQDILPPGVFSVISGDGADLGKWITAHPGIDKVAFTGSTATGKDVMRASAGTLKRVTLELGGNDPAIVLPDVDIEAVVPQVFWAAFQNSAQFCNAAKRIYVHQDIYEDFRAAFVEFARTIKVGNGADADTALGPIQNEPQYRKVAEYITDCHANGHRFALGGELDRTAPGWFVPVSIVDNPPEDSRIVREEPFGPIVPLLMWNDEADVITRANDTRYGLGASVWSADVEAAQRIGRRLEAGTVWLNEIHQYTPYSPNGGHKESGIGCENSVYGLREYTNTQTVTLNRNGATTAGGAS
ncbi:aldehyde dehydrogenase family protein [Nocardia nova]|uniref:aldehyde dehydrogenase family protein n=1 Tax=Nocardia nova TaxID=37330 RepID=UPI0033E1EA6C